MKASPTITTTLSASSITAGSTANDASALSGAGTHGPATVAYSYYTNNTCTTGEVAVNTVTCRQRDRAQLERRHLRQRRHLLLAGGLQRRRQQHRGLEPVHGGEQRAAHGHQGVADDRHDAVGVEHQRWRNGQRHIGAERGGRLDGRRHGRLQLLHQQHLHDGQGGGEHGDGADQRQRTQLERGHFQQRRHLLLAGGLQR